MCKIAGSQGQSFRVTCVCPVPRSTASVIMLERSLAPLTIDRENTPFPRVGYIRVFSFMEQADFRLPREMPGNFPIFCSSVGSVIECPVCVPVITLKQRQEELAPPGHHGSSLRGGGCTGVFSVL